MAQLSFWGNYLPHVYPVHLRGTGESFAANIGGRLIGTSAAAVAAYVASLMPYDTIPLAVFRGSRNRRHVRLCDGFLCQLLAARAATARSRRLICVR